MRGVLQMLRIRAKMVAPVTVQHIESPASPNDFHILTLDCGTALRARTVLIAAGVRWRKLDAEGAERFESAGIHYACTSVEAMLYDQQDVAVVGAGQFRRAGGDVPRGMLPRSPGPSSGPPAAGAGNVRLSRQPNPRRRQHHRPRGHRDRRRARPAAIGIRHVAQFNPDLDMPTNDPSPEVLPISAAFVFIGADPGCSWLPESLARDKLGYILTGMDALRSGRWPLKDREPCPLETTVPGILAAGDIRAGSTKRVGFAVGDGSLAVTCVHKLTAIRS